MIDIDNKEKLMHLIEENGRLYAGGGAAPPGQAKPGSPAVARLVSEMEERARRTEAAP